MMSFMLSDNGWRKAEKHLCPERWGENNWTTSDEPIFEQDDLQGMVVLTIEQAKELATKLQQNANFFFLQTGEFDYDTDDLRQFLTEKIEQVEKHNG